MARGPRFYLTSPGEQEKDLGQGKVMSTQMSCLRQHRVSGFLLPSCQINDLRSQKTPIESLFIEATEKFRSNLKTMYSVPVRVDLSPRGALAIPSPSAQDSPRPICAM